MAGVRGQGKGSEKMSNKVYNILKYISVIVIPAIVLFINTLGQIWDWEHTTEITASISALGVFIGALIQVSSSKYAKKIENLYSTPDEATQEDNKD